MENAALPLTGPPATSPMVSLAGLTTCFVQCLPALVLYLLAPVGISQTGASVRESEIRQLGLTPKSIIFRAVGS